MDGAIRAASEHKGISDAPKLVKFVPFDPTKKMSEATATDLTGGSATYRKGRLFRGHRPYTTAAGQCGGGEGT